MSENDRLACALARGACVPCASGAEPLKGTDIENLLSKLSENWQVIEAHHLERTYKFRNSAMGLIL